MVLTERQMCCGLFVGVIFSSGGDIGKMDMLCIWAEM